MATKTSCEVQVNLFPQTAIPQVQFDEFCIADSIADLLQPQGSSTQGTAPITDGTLQPGTAYVGQNNFTSIDPSIEPLCLGPDPRTGSAAALDNAPTYLICQRYRYPQNNRMSPDQPTLYPPSNAQWPDLLWKQQTPNATGETNFQTLQPDLPNPAVTWIANTLQKPNTSVEVETVSPILANQQQHVEFIFKDIATGHTGGAGVRYCWEDQNRSVVIRSDASPTVEFMLPPPGGGPKDWATVATFDKIPPSTFQGNLVLDIFQDVGQLRIRISAEDGSQHTVVLLDSTTDSRGNIDYNEVAWKSGKVMFRTFGVQIAMGVSFWNHNQAVANDSGQLVPGPAQMVTAVRTIKRTLRKDPSVSSAGGECGGWARRGTTTNALATATSEQVQYTIEMTPSDDGVLGPAVSSVMIQFVGAWINPTVSPLNIASSTISLNSSSSDPVLAGTTMEQWTIEGDGAHLQLDAANLNYDWSTYLAERNPVQIQQRWKYSDGSYDPWVVAFNGYIWRIKYGARGVDQWPISINCYDPIMRLMAPNSLIDERFTPMDLLFIRKGGAALFGEDCVREILRIELGQVEANRLNGGAPARYLFPPDQYPLMSYNSETFGYLNYPTSPPSTNTGFRLIPPYLHAAGLDWMKDFGGMDRAVIYYGICPGYESAGPSLIYGRYPLIVQKFATSPKILPDAVYTPGDENSVLFLAEVEGQPTKDFNNVLVVGNPAGSSNDGYSGVLAPGLAMVRRRVSTSSPNREELSWRRTLPITDPHIIIYNDGDISQLTDIADYEVSQLEGLKIRFPSLDFRGDINVRWGMTVQPNMIADGSTGDISNPYVNLSGQQFRVFRTNHSINLREFGEEMFKTSCTVAPVNPNTGI